MRNDVGARPLEDYFRTSYDRFVGAYLQGQYDIDQSFYDYFAGPLVMYMEFGPTPELRATAWATATTEIALPLAPDKLALPDFASRADIVYQWLMRRRPRSRSRPARPRSATSCSAASIAR